MTQREDSILDIAARWVDEGQGVALATVISTWGSSPRPVGSQVVINESRNFEGSVSGGCVESAVIEEAVDVIESGEPRMLIFGVTNEQAWEVGLACGGEIHIYLEPVQLN